MKQVSFSDVKLGGWWQKRCELNRAVTLPAVREQFSKTGRFDAFKCDWHEGCEIPEPHFFWDSDVAKWLEAAAFCIENKYDEKLVSQINETVDLIEKNQDKDGYFNIYYMTVEPDGRFTNRMNHELYCAGHLLEAAVAFDCATGDGRFLGLMRKYMIYIKKVIIDEKTALFETPGHEEIELALLKAYEHTGDSLYLELSKFFLDTRGASQKDDDSPFYIDQAYSQSDKPCRELREAKGHSVRACYLYMAMADYARIARDKQMEDTCRILFDDIKSKKLYITGGIGASQIGEAFSEGYDLPNSLAYSETCAAISLALFARRMSLLEINSKYDDVAELAIYNTVLSGNSVDGKSFFYENPLEINLRERKNTIAHRNKNQHFPLTERVEVFGCSCCPPNIARFIASIGDFLYTTNSDTLFVHHYAESVTKIGDATVTQNTDYPNNGNVKLSVSGGFKTVAVRVPAWCESYSFKQNSKEIHPEIKDGFAYFDIAENAVIEMNFEMKPMLIESNPLLENSFGRAALMRGPFVYCLESVDNTTPLRSLSVKKELNAELILDSSFNAYIIEADGVEYELFDGLYRHYTQNGEPTRLKFIPYFAFANRGESDMLVWVRVDSQ